MLKSTDAYRFANWMYIYCRLPLQVAIAMPNEYGIRLKLAIAYYTHVPRRI